MKKIITLLLTLCVMITSVRVVPVVNAEDSQYTYDSKTRTLTINYFDDHKEPWINIEYPENIVIKEGIETIPDEMFMFVTEGNSGERYDYYDRIKTVKLPKSIKVIGEKAFYNCKKLNTINIPNGVKSIGDWAFIYCKSLKKITIPGSVKTIPELAFQDCKSLKSVELKKGVKKIKKEAFYGCEKLKEIQFSNSIKEIDSSAFIGCGFETVKLSKKLKTIKSYTFHSCDKLKKVTIKNKVSKIEKYAFGNCKRLKKIKVPKSVKKIGTRAFGYKEKKSGSSYKYVRIKGFTIKGYKGTAAQKYAKKDKFKFVALKK